MAGSIFDTLGDEPKPFKNSNMTEADYTLLKNGLTREFTDSLRNQDPQYSIAVAEIARVLVELETFVATFGFKPAP